MNSLLKKIIPAFFLAALFTLPGAANAKGPDSFFDITYDLSISPSADGTVPQFEVRVRDNVSGEPRDVTVREVHRYERRGLGDDPDDLCTVSMVVDLGGNQLVRIEADYRAVIDDLGQIVGYETAISDIAPHRGHVTVLK